MTTKTQTTLASAAGMLWKVIESYNKDPEPYFRKAHIDPRLINDPSARFNLTAMDNVYHELYQQVDDPCMGLKLASVGLCMAGQFYALYGIESPLTLCAHHK